MKTGARRPVTADDSPAACSNRKRRVATITLSTVAAHVRAISAGDGKRRNAVLSGETSSSSQAWGSARGHSGPTISGEDEANNMWARSFVGCCARWCR